MARKTHCPPPHRLDALVWAIPALMLQREASQG
jgi:phage terminase large subunit-like protein